MSDNSKLMVGVAIIVSLIIGGALGWMYAPKGTETQIETVYQAPLEGKTINIGVISGSTAGLETLKPMYQSIITPGINAYAQKLGYDVDFNFLIDDATGQAAIHLEKVQSFKASGVNNIITSSWSSQNQASLSYANENDIMMVSPGSTSVLLALEDDNLFRLCPNDYAQGRALPQMHASWGIEAVLVIQRGDSWGDGVYNFIEQGFPNYGIVILDRVRYATEVTEFSNYLSTMNDIIGRAIDDYGAEHVSIQGMCLDEWAVLLTQADDYENLKKVVWFGTENAGRNTRVVDDVGEKAVPYKIFGPLMGPSKTNKWYNFEEDYINLVGLAPDFYTGNGYDISYLIASSIIDTQSLDATDSMRVFPDVASNYFGVTGWCNLDEVGDREPGIYDIWGYAVLDGEATFVRYGEWDGRENTVSWNLKLLASQGVDVEKYGLSELWSAN